MKAGLFAFGFGCRSQELAERVGTQLFEASLINLNLFLVALAETELAARIVELKRQLDFRVVKFRTHFRTSYRKLLKRSDVLIALAAHVLTQDALRKYVAIASCVISVVHISAGPAFPRASFQGLSLCVMLRRPKAVNPL